MIDLKYIGGYFPPHIASNAIMQKHILKEYVELMALDYISTTSYIQKAERCYYQEVDRS